MSIPDADGAEALAALRRGAPPEIDRLLPIVYDELRRMAHRQLSLERDGHTLNTTALVHEAYILLSEQRRLNVSDRHHFFAIAARVMRRVLIDHARRHSARRRGGPAKRQVGLTDLEAGEALAVEERASELLDLDDALDRLSAFDPRLAAIVECRFFGGLTETETAEALGMSKRTVARGWGVARGWLHQQLRPS